MRNNMRKQFIIVAIAKARILSTPLSHGYLTLIQTWEMIPHCLEYNIGCPWPSYLYCYQNHQNTLECKLQDLHLTRLTAVRIVHKTLAIPVFTCFKSKIATKQLRNTSSTRRVSDSGLCLALRRAVLMQSWSIFACSLAFLRRVRSRVRQALVYSFCSSAMAGQQFWGI